MNDAGSHIADQPERIEEYLLGHLGRTASDAIEEHLRSCRRCAEAVASERRLLAAIRRTGRDAGKERLRAGIVADESTLHIGTPWPRIFGIAATVVILLGFGIAGRWLFLHHGAENPVTEQAARTLSQEPQVLPQESPRQTMGASPQVKKDLRAEPAPWDRAELPPDNAAGVKGVAPGLADQADRRAPRPAIAEESKEVIGSQAEVANELSKTNAGSDRAAANAPFRDAGQRAGARTVAVTLVLEGAPQHRFKALGRSDALFPQKATDTATVHLTVTLPHRDSAFLRLTPVTRWITDDSVLVSVGDTTAGYRIR